MALVVESTSTISGNDSDNLTITKPTGTSEGDLLVYVGHGQSGIYPTISGFSIGVTNSQDNSGILPDSDVAVLYKIAGASEPANYTIGLTGANTLGLGAMFRISGWSVGNPVYASSFSAGTVDAASYSINPTGLTISRPVGQVLILLSYFNSQISPTTDASASGYAITSSDNNPTWTEVIDGTVNTAAGLYRDSFAVAYAVTTDTSDITAWNIDLAIDTSGDADAFHGGLIVICEPTNASGTTSLHTATPTEFSETSVEVGTSGTNTLHTPTTTLNTASGRATSPTQWTNETKPSTTWTNEEK